MTDPIQVLLQQDFLMFYHDNWPMSQLCPVQTLTGAMEVVNKHLVSHGRRLQEWPDSAADEVARIMQVHWIYQRLDWEPIRKPIAVHFDSDRWLVDCGDTRIMSMTLKNPDALLPVVTTVRKDQTHICCRWTPIESAADLIQRLNFQPDTTQIFYQKTLPGSDHAMSWFEIGDATTSHHLHDLRQRLAMIQNYLSTQPQSFRFSVEWFDTPVEWNLY